MIEKNPMLDQMLAIVSGKEVLSIPWYIYKGCSEDFVPEYDPYCTNENNCLPILSFCRIIKFSLHSIFCHILEKFFKENKWNKLQCLIKIKRKNWTKWQCFCSKSQEKKT